jgi:Flp pilus assembly pilin Flp
MAKLPLRLSGLLSGLRSLVTRLRTGLAADERGATAIEYGVIAAGVGAFLAATIFGFGSSLKTVFYDKLASLL